MDPVTAIGLASAIVTFVSIGTRIAKRVKELSEAGDVPEVFRDIETRLSFFMSLVDRTRNETDRLTLDAERALERVVKQCLQQARQLEEILNKVTVSKGDSRFRRIVKAGVSVIEESRMLKIAAALKDNVQLLTFLNVTPAERERPVAERKPSEPLPSYMSTTGFFLVPFSRDDQFVGREDPLQSIDLSFRKNNRVAVSGTGGVG